MSSPVSIPASWSAHVNPVPSGSPLWLAAGRLARSGAQAAKAELATLIELTSSVDVSLKGPDGTPLLVQVLDNWHELLPGEDRNPWPGMTHIIHGQALACLPLPGEPAWDGTGAVEPWVLPAANLIARGADPFETGPDGRSGFSMAITVGSNALLAQMLRHPACPSPSRWPAGRIQAISSRLYSDASLRWVKLPALHLSLFENEARCFDALLARADSMALDAIDEEGNTVLHLAVAEGHGGKVRALLAAGASPWLENAFGRVPAEDLWSPVESRGIKECWNAMLAQDDPVHMKRSRFTAAYLGLPMASWPSPLAPTALLAERGPGSSSLLEWAVAGALARQAAGEVGSLFALRQMMDRVPWPEQSLAEARWMLPDVSVKDLDPAALHGLEQRLLSIGSDHGTWCRVLSELTQSSSRPIPASSPLWDVWADALVKEWSVGTSDPDRASSTMEAIILAPDVLSTWRAAPCAEGLIAFLYAKTLTPRFFREEETVAVESWPTLERGWSTTRHGLGFSRVWPRMRSLFSVMEQSRIDGMLEADVLDVALPGSESLRNKPRI